MLHEVLIKKITSNGHLRLIEWVFEDVVAVKIVNPAQKAGKLGVRMPDECKHGSQDSGIKESQKA